MSQRAEAGTPFAIEICKTYETFGDCRYGSSCKKRHTGKVYDQEYILGVLGGDPVGETLLEKQGEGENETFHIPPRDPWCRGNARSGDFVLFQASSKHWRSREYGIGEIRFGRIVNIVYSNPDDNSQELIRTQPHKLPSFTNLNTVYTLGPPGTKRFGNAYSVDGCSNPEHSTCKVIGVYVASDVLGSGCKIAPSVISKHSQIHRFCRGISLKQGEVAMALSIYIHTGSVTTNDTTEGPELRLIKVEENFIFGSPASIPLFDTLWKFFVPNERRPNKLRVRSLHKYLTFSPELWKEYYLVNRMMFFFNNAIKSWAQLSTSSFITKVWDEYRTTNFEQGTVAIFEDLFHGVNDNNNEEIDKALLTGLKQKHWLNSGTHFLPKYRWTAGTAQGSTDNYLQCTSPMRKIYDFVNQQIIIHSLLKSEGDFYTARELLGILVKRFETPQLDKAIVKKLKPHALTLGYVVVSNVPDNIYDAPYSIFTGSEEMYCGGKIEILIKGIPKTGVEYCNRRVIHMDLRTLKNLLEGDRNEYLRPDGVVEESPYVRIGEDTKFILQPGIELQIQTSQADARKNHPLKWRLLKIAKDFHFCFCHLNNPELAFMSERKDVREIVTEQRIQSLQNHLRSHRHGSTITDIEIDWHDRYYSGGSFQSNRKVGDRGAFLCIRKDVSNGRNYVWCCHAVIIRVTEEISETWKFYFEVCTLSQSETVSETDGFVVEILSQEDSVKETQTEGNDVLVPTKVLSEKEEEEAE